MRRMSQAEVTPPAIAPIPCAVPMTPTKDGERWRASLVTAKISVSENPATSSAVARPIVSSRSTRVRAMCVRPAEISLHEVVLLHGARRLGEAERDERCSRDEERRRVDDRDDGAAPGGEDARARERRDEAQPFADRLVRAVRLGEQLVGDHRLQHRAARGREDVAAEAVEQRDAVEDPHVAAVVHEEQEAHHARERELRRDHQRPLGQPVDDEAAERRDEARSAEHEEDEARLRSTSR